MSHSCQLCRAWLVFGTQQLAEAALQEEEEEEERCHTAEQQILGQTAWACPCTTQAPASLHSSMAPFAHLPQPGLWPMGTDPPPRSCRSLSLSLSPTDSLRQPHPRSPAAGIDGSCLTAPAGCPLCQPAPRSQESRLGTPSPCVAQGQHPAHRASALPTGPGSQTWSGSAQGRGPDPGRASLERLRDSLELGELGDESDPSTPSVFRCLSFLPSAAAFLLSPAHPHAPRLARINPLAAAAAPHTQRWSRGSSQDP